MNIIYRLKYRWEFESDPLPGELITTTKGVRLIAWTIPKDREKNLILRKLRALLFGYGQGWTFLEALVSVVFHV